MSLGALLIAGLAVALILEGLAYALAPDFMKRLAAIAQSMSRDDLRQGGLIALVCGSFALYAIYRLTG